jgi:hypothetical protein
MSYARLASKRLTAFDSAEEKCRSMGIGLGGRLSVAAFPWLAIMEDEAFCAVRIKFVYRMGEPKIFVDRSPESGY